MRFSLQLHYAIAGIFDLAYNGLGRPVQVRVIGERQGIPTRYLEQIFQRLRRAKLVAGKRGPGGGYVLARSASEISLLDVVEAVEGPIGGFEDAEGEGAEPTGPARGEGRPDFISELLAQRLSAVLAELRLDALCREAAQRGVSRLSEVAPDYQI